MQSEPTAVWEAMIQSDPAPICAFDTAYRLVAFNRAHNDEFRRVNGFDSKLGDVFPDLFVPEQRPVMRALMARALAGETFTAVEEFGRAALGVPHWAIRYTPIRDAAGAVVGAYHRAEDVGARRELEAELRRALERLGESRDAETAAVALADERGREQVAVRESELRFRTMADGAPVMIWVTDPSGRCTYLNRRWYAFTGQTEGAGEAYGWLDAVHPDDRPVAEEAFVSANAARRDYRVEFRIRRADGAYRWAIDAAAARFDGDGAYLGYVGSLIDIDERREAEEALRLSTARAEDLAAERAAILGQLAEGVIVTDRSGRITFVNAAAERLHGVARLDVVPDAYSETYHLLTPDGDPYPPERLPLARAVRDGEVVYDERWRIRRPCGGEVLAIGGARPVLDAAGTQVGAVLTLRDDTERSRAEAAMRESEARYRTLFEAIEAGFCIIELRFDVDGRAVDYRFAEVNPAFERQTGIRDAVGRWATEAAPGLERHWFDLYGRVALTGEPARFEEEAVPLGRWFDVHAFRTGPEAERRVAVLFNDITARKKAEGSLRALNAQLEERVSERTAERDGAWRLSQDLLAVAGKDGALAAVNGAWSVLLGWEPDELVGRPFAEFTHPDDLEATLAAFAGIFDAPLTTPYEYRLRHRDGGYRWFAWTGAFERGSVYASGRHTTHEREQAEALAQAQDALRQAQKMEAVGQLTGGIAHDFNNMLAVVIGSLDLLGRRLGSDDARARRYVDAATDGARRAALLTQRLLAFSRQQPLRPEAVDMGRLVTGMSDLIRGSIGGDIRFETVVTGGGWRTYADPNQLENVLLNLAVNARDAMPDGGRLTIETQNAHLDDRYAAAHPGVPAGQYVLVAVTDTGSGMPEDVIAKAFDPFFTTKAVGKGTGLGLSQAYGFVKQSGGHLKIYSEPGQGTTVKVYLPRLVGAEHDAAAAEAAPDLPLGEREELVLVVEDEPAVWRFSVDALGELGYRVIEADGAAAALRLLDAHPEIALMFTDVVMPDVNGAKLADEARRRRPDLRVLFTTGYTRNAVVHNGVLDPGVELIGKPFTIEELAAKVREVLDTPLPARG
ncbi:PAS domain S-box protein [uncultured Sphingomonas sp.]|uniref:PAS domain-containing hybrid sensor histidine kinase/response regulator n=1 Tax=uncultured Sphingomonas sp. TaxID=158754 RepID=UPI0035CAF8B7